MTSPAWSPSKLPDVSNPSFGVSAAVAGAIAPSGIASAEAFGSSTVAASAAVLGFVATRTSIPTTRAGATTPVMTRSFHYARDNISALKVVFANFYGQDETSSGGSLTVKASVEYPLGTFTQLTFSGVAQGSTSGQLLTSDLVTLTTPIPNGAKFYIRFLHTYSGGVIYCQIGNPAFPAGGDTTQFGAATDQTMGGTITDDGSQLGFYPAAIVGMTAKRTLLLVGDSRTNGAADTADASGDTGELARALGPTYAYASVASSGQSASHWAAAHSARVALGQYATTVLCNLGINDFQATATVAAVQTSILGIRSDLSAKEFWGCTITPFTQFSTAWTAADGSDQTVTEPIGQKVVDLNTWIRTSGGGAFTGFLEVASQLQLGSNVRKWKADGTAAKYTADGLHGTPFANKSIVLTLP